MIYTARSERRGVVGTRGVFSSTSALASGSGLLVRSLGKILRTDAHILLTGIVIDEFSSSSSLVSAGAMGVSVAPRSGEPGGSVTSALQVGHCSSARSTVFRF
jgi:hypothetical protein